MDGGRWFAPGKGFTLEGQEQDDAVALHKLLGQFIQRVGIPSDSTPVAVGSPFAIWERCAEQWRKRGIGGRRPRGKFADILAYIDEVQDDGQTRVLAFGPVTLAQRSAKDDWSLAPNQNVERLMKLARHGPQKALECAPVLWRWFGKAHGWYLCEDGRSYIFDGQANQPLPEVSAECAQDAGGSNVTAAGVSFLCNGTLMLLRKNETAWAKVPAPDELYSVALGPNCILANSKQTVWRLCPTSPTK